VVENGRSRKPSFFDLRAENGQGKYFSVFYQGSRP
jgi:hypothetical protein